MDVEARHRAIEPLQACFNCLASGHSYRQCPSKRTCKSCGRKHHTLLHRGDPAPPPPSNEPMSTTQSTAPSNDSSVELNTLTANVPSETSLVLTCQAVVESGGRAHIIRAMIDTGSSRSFITERTATLLNAEQISSPVSIIGLGGSPAATSGGHQKLLSRSLRTL